jgi:large subunit ribosomal protein L9
MAYKLLLLDDVETLGRSGDIVNTRPGYARNFLLPRGLAVVADKNTLRKQARLQEERNKKATADKQESEEHANRIKDLTVTTIVKVDHDGHMYGSVTSTDIIRLLEEQSSVVLEKRAIQLSHAIKEVGVHTIKVKLKEGVATSFVLTILPDESHMPTKKTEEAPKEEEA